MYKRPFYDRATDPSEMKSVYSDTAQKERIEEMKEELQRLRKHYEVPEEQQ